MTKKEMQEILKAQEKKIEELDLSLARMQWEAMWYRYVGALLGRT